MSGEEVIEGGKERYADGGEGWRRSGRKEGRTGDVHSSLKQADYQCEQTSKRKI